MKNYFPFIFMIMLFSIFINGIEAQTIVEDVDVKPEQTKFKMDDRATSFLMEIGGPGNYYWKQKFENSTDITLTNTRADGKKFPDGAYTLQITPIIELSAEMEAELRAASMQNDETAMVAFRKKHKLPSNVDIYSGNFRIMAGKFVSPDVNEKQLRIPTKSSQWEQHHPVAYASVETVPVYFRGLSALPNDNTALSEDDQVFLDDVIVNGSICVGQDCVNGESFGFDTIRVKENNLRIKFQDTSTSASFPTNDWQITANDSSNGGANKFSIDDIDGGRTPFTIEAGARTNALYVDDGGRIGIGTNTPVVDIHDKSGNTPTLRLDQDGSSGFTPQAWDVAGNETNFFIRDASNGSTLPFRIRPGAPSSAIDIAASGNVGINTGSPNSALHVNSTGAMTVPLGTTAQQPAGAEGMLRGNSDANYLEYFNGTGWSAVGDSQWSQSGTDIHYSGGKVGIGVVPTVPLDVVGNVKVAGTSTFTGRTFVRGNLSVTMTANATFLSSTSSPVLRVDGVNERVGIGTLTPGHQLELTQDDAVKPNGGSWSGPSDLRLKRDVVDFTEGLDAVLKIRPVKYHYNGKLGLPSDQEFIGVVAQEMQQFAPYTIKKLNHKGDNDEDYLAFDPTPVTYMLVNAVKEQQTVIEHQQVEIDALKNQLTELDALKLQISSLTEMIQNLNVANGGTKTQDDKK